MNNIVVIYKEVGRTPVFREIPNSIKCFETILGGEVDFIPYEEIEIVCLKNRANLKPNIYLSGLSGNDAFSIRGNLLIVKKDKEEFKTLTKDEAVRYGTIIVSEKFDHSRFDENGKYLSNRALKRRRQKERKEANKDNSTKTDKNDNDDSQDTEEILIKKALEMISKIQLALIEFMNFYREYK